VTLSFGETIALLPHVKSGRLRRALGVTTLKRWAVMPDLPTVAETIPGYAAGPWYGISRASENTRGHHCEAEQRSRRHLAHA